MSDETVARPARGRDDVAGPGCVPGALGRADPDRNGRTGDRVGKQGRERADTVVATSTTDTVLVALELAEAQSGHPFTVFYPDGTSVGSAAEPSDAVELALRQGRTLDAEAEGGREVLVALGLGDGGTGAVHTFVTDDELTAGVLRIWLLLGTLGFGLVVLAVLVADRMARGLVRPVVEASAVSHRLAAGDLDARAEPAGPPELRAVATGLNHLAGRITGMLREERETVADLSHRLRTPLTVLRLEAEALPDDERSGRIVGGVDALERAVTQVIRDARSRGVAAEAECDAADVVSDRVAFWSVLAEDTGRELDVVLDPGPLPVRSTADDLAAAVDALLGNVFAHTPDGTPLAVRLEHGPGGARVVVADSSPGFVDPGAVGRGASMAASTGLGLDIARRVAETSGGAFVVGVSALGGAQVTLELGPPETEVAGSHR
ncbi:MAG: sensor histidine kinase [Jiangellaceae bacterium]